MGSGTGGVDRVGVRMGGGYDYVVEVPPMTVIKLYVDVHTAEDYERLEHMLAEHFTQSYISTETVTKTLRELEEEEDS